MGFKSFMKKLGGGVQVTTNILNGPALKPIMDSIPIVGSVLNIVTSAEQLFPKPGSGEQKEAAAMDALTQMYPGIDPAVLALALKNVVAAMNAIQKPSQ